MSTKQMKCPTITGIDSLATAQSGSPWTQTSNRSSTFFLYFLRYSGWIFPSRTSSVIVFSSITE